MAELRKGAREAGRSASDLLIFTLLTVIVGRTDEEAQAKYAEYRSYVSHEGALALMAGWTRIDFAEYDLDEPIKYIKNDAIQSATEALTSADPDASGRCARLRSSVALAVSVRWWSARPSVWPTSCSPGLRKPTSTASTWPMR